jgi:hypothetical protein
MALHDELLTLAKELVDRNPGAAIAGDLRRGISSAYYAVFHLLIHEATSRLITVPSLRGRVGRAFDHHVMRRVCETYAGLRPNAGGQLVLDGQVIPQGIKNIATEFIMLQAARHQADYDFLAVITQAQAQTDVTRAELVFLDWGAVQADPASDGFLTELLCRGMPRR